METNHKPIKTTLGDYEYRGYRIVKVQKRYWKWEVRGQQISQAKPVASLRDGMSSIDRLIEETK
jgi:hypothetical protein